MLMRKVFLITIFCINYNILLGNENSFIIIEKCKSLIDRNNKLRLDSLHYIIQNFSIKKEERNGYLFFCEGYVYQLNNNYLKAVDAFSKASKEFSNRNYDLFVLSKYYKCYNLYDLNQFNNIIIELSKFSDENIALLKLENNKLIVDLNNLLGLAYKKTGQLFLAKKQFQKALNLCDRNDVKSQNKLKQNLSLILYNQTEYESALKISLELLHYYKQNLDTSNIISSLIDIADIYKESTNYITSEKFYKEALGLLGDNVKSYKLTRIYEGLAILNSYRNNYNLSNYYLEQALYIDKINKNKSGIIYSTNNLCKNYIVQQRKNDDILKLLKSVIELENELKDIKSKYYSIYLIALYYDNIGKNKLAIKYYKITLKYHKTEKYLNLVFDIEKRLSKCYENLNLYKESLIYLKLAAQTSDSIYNENKIKIIGELNQKYESDQKDLIIANQKISSLEKDNRLKKQIYSSVVIVICLLCILLYLIYLYNYNRKLLIRKKEELNLKVSDLQSFNYAVSHDLRNPITTIKNQLDLLSKDSLLFNLNIVNKLNVIKITINQIDRLIEEIYKLSTIENIDERFSNINLFDLLNDAIEEFEQEISQKNIVININSKLPKINCDILLMKQVFINIIGNSIKYMENNNPVIEINSNSNNHYHEITISDNGQGVDEESLQNIFNLFVRGKNSIDKNGVGAGLAIAKKIIAKHHGEIHAIKNLPSGLTIIIELPISYK